MDGDKLIQQMGSKKLPNLTRMSNYQTQRGSSVDLSNDTHDENYSSTTSCRSTQGILSSYPHSTILSLANRHSASVVYSQSPIVSIPEQNSSIAHGFDQSVDGKMDKFTCENRSHYSSSVAQSLYCESLMPMNSSNKPLNEIQSCTGTIVVSMVNAVNQSACQPRLNISQTMLNVSQQSCTTSSRLTPTTPPPPPPKGPVYKWTPDDVVAFVRGTPGCGAYASAFLNNEIDGEALLLLAEDQFIQPPIGMKIGPALKLVARLESLRHCC
ncbi:unnamed protein product [Heterobilharzia americana]|nr:unnamed protein product [Heterobilharzia americana]